MMQAAPTQTHPKTFNPILETDYDVVICKIERNGETIYQPKIVAQGTTLPVFWQLPAFNALFGTHGSDGDNLGDKKQFNKSVDQAVVTYTLIPGCPYKKVGKAMPNLVNEQKQAMDKLKKQHTELLVAAFESDEVKCAGKDKARKQAASALKKAGNKKPSKEQIDKEAKKIYLANANDSGIKELTWIENDEEIEGEAIKIKRKVRGKRYKDGELTLVNTFPTFHRGDAVGNYHEIFFGDYMPRNTLIILRGRRGWYTTPMMYGTNLTFDQDVIVLCGPKQRKKTKESKPVIFFEDEDYASSSSGKRKRDDESDEAPSPKH